MITIQENIFYWPGKYKASLIYMLSDKDTGDVFQSLVKDAPMFFSEFKGKFYIGKKAIDLSGFYPQIELGHVLSDDVSRLEASDFIDSTGAIINHLMSALSDEVEKQFKSEISPETVVQVLDFDGTFKEASQRLINILPLYADRSVEIVDASTLIKKLISKDEKSDWLFIDDAIASGTAKNMPDTVKTLPFFSTIESLAGGFLPNLKITNRQFHALCSMLDTSSAYGEKDWYYISISDAADLGGHQWSVDKYHLFRGIWKKIQENNVSFEAGRAIRVVGAFCNLAARAISHSSSNRITKISRRLLVEMCLRNKVFNVEKVLENNKELSVQFNSEDPIALEIQNQSASVTYTLKLFGRKSEKVIVSMNDGTEAFFVWQFDLNFNSSLDIYDIKFHFNQSECGFIDCELEPADEFFLVSKSAVPMRGARVRPVDELRMIAQAS